MRHREFMTKAAGMLCAALYAMILCVVPSALCADTKALFYVANSLYEEGRYDEAIGKYNSILERGFESGNIYYNLGNCFVKKGRPGRAILNYEKARRLMPLDKDLESNYEYARSLISNGAVDSKESPPLKVLNYLSGKLTIDGLTILMSALYIIAMLCVLIGLFAGPFMKGALISAVFCGLIFLAGLAGLRAKIACVNKEAIVVVEQADVKFEPADKATTYFNLYEGMKVSVISAKGGWYKARRPDNKSGWVRDSAIAIF